MREGGDVEIHKKMGKALERVTVKVLAEFGLHPTIFNGEYAGKWKGGPPEVDIALETDERIFLIECTKKPLTTAARGGSTISALQDLDGSFLKLLQQLARHEAELRTKGAISFADEGVRIEGTPS
jgi:hypothetical protein